MDLLDKLRAVASRMEPHAHDRFRPFLTTIDSLINPGEVVIQGRRTLMFGSNNYFGLTNHPEVIAAAKHALDLYGSGTTGSRIANGTLAAHEALEHDFARFFGKRDREHFHDRLPGQSRHDRRALRAGRRGDARRRKPREHLRCDAAVGRGSRLGSAQLTVEPREKAGTAAEARAKSTRRGRRVVFDSRRRRAASRDRRGVPRARCVHPCRRSAFVRHLRRARPRMRGRAGRARSGGFPRRHLFEDARRRRRILRVESSRAARNLFRGPRVCVHGIGHARKRCRRPCRARHHRPRSIVPRSLVEERPSVSIGTAGGGLRCRSGRIAA